MRELRKFVEGTVVDKNELFNEKVQLEPEESLEVPKEEKKRVLLIIGVNPEGGLEKKKKAPEKWGIKQRRGGGAAGVTLATERG